MLKKILPPLPRNPVRALMFVLTLLMSIFMPIYGLLIPLVLAGLEWLSHGEIVGEQRVKLAFLIAGGLSGIIVHFLAFGLPAS